MSASLYLAFVAATAVLMAIPGPNVALIVAGSLTHGRRFGLATVAGTSAAMAPQLVLVGLGMAQMLGQFGQWFAELRWVGIAYLVWLGVRAWRAPPEDLSQVRPQDGSARRAFMRGFLVSLTNPKTLFFYAAFFPQFIAPHAPLAPQLVLLSLTFLAIAMAMDSGWAVFADRFRGLLAARGRIRNRITGGVFIAAGVGLAAARKAT